MSYESLSAPANHNPNRLHDHSTAELDAYLRRELVSYSAILEQIAAEERSLLQAEICNARYNWDASRRDEAVKLGARLARNPERVASRLRQTKQGAEWLLNRWNHLADVLKKGQTWTDKQRRLALDLTGVPTDLRDPDAAIPDPGALAQQEMTALTTLRDKSLTEIDGCARFCSSNGNPLEPSRALQAVRRRHAVLTRLFHNAHKLLTRTPPTRLPASSPSLSHRASLSDIAPLTPTPIPAPPKPAPTSSRTPAPNRQARRAAAALSRRR